MNQINTEKTGVKAVGLWPLYVAVGVVIGLWALSGWWVDQRGTAERGTFGDMFGAINALFSGLAFATLIYTIWLQRYELQLQREELEATREELKGQREEMAAQNGMLRVQNFENKFFQMLRSFNEILAHVSVEYHAERKTLHGKQAFVLLCEQLLEQLRVQDVVDGFNVKRDTPIAYQEFYRRAGHLVEPYLLMLLGLLRFVDRSDVAEKTFYSELVRNQLSKHELTVLYYNSVANNYEEWADSKLLMERYAMFKHLNTNMLAHPDDFTLISIDAYGIGPR